MSGRTERSLFRSLLRLSTRFDKNPGAKLLFYRKRLAEGAGGEELTSSAESYFTREVIPLVFQESYQAKLLNPKSTSLLHLYAIVRSEFRTIRDQYSRSDRIDAAFITQRKLSLLWKNYSSMLKSAKVPSGPLVSSSNAMIANHLCVSESSSLLPGIILISHPMIQGPLKRAVILLLEHNTSGSYGVVINRPSRHTLASAVKNLPGPILDSFGQKQVGFGGMVRRLQFLHSSPEVAGTPIPLCARPFFAGGKIAIASDLVKLERSKLEDFHFFVGCCTWDKDELEAELATGYWIPVQSQVDEILRGWAKQGPEEKENELPARARSPSSASKTSDDSPDPSVSPSIASSLDRAIDEMAASTSGEMDSLWKSLLSKLGNAYRPALTLDHTIDAGKLPSLDS